MEIIHHNPIAGYVTVELQPSDIAHMLNLANLLDRNEIVLHPWNDSPYQFEIAKVECQANRCLVFLEY